MKLIDCIRHAQAFVDLLFPFVEAVIHDLSSQTIVAMFNSFSDRKVGDPTPFHELNIDTQSFPDYFPPYYMHTIHGRKIKCISLTIRDEMHKPCFLICYNLDTTLFHDVEKKFSQLLTLQTKGESPLEISGENWQASIQEQIQTYLEYEKKSIANLSKEEKKSLLHYLYKKGVFHYKNAAPYIAKVLHISKASLYNYLKIR